jgi:putative redox protein
MDITIHHHQDLHFSAHDDEHHVVIDLPERYGGTNLGMNPPQLFVTALGACIGVYVANYCDEHIIPYQGMQLLLNWSYKDKPQRIGKVRMQLKLPSGPLAVEHELGLHRSIENCLLYNTLAHKPDVCIEILAHYPGDTSRELNVMTR